MSEAAHVLPEAIAAADRRGLAVRAWTVFLHNGALAAAHPECAPENAFGDRYVTELCPANPDARAYARALAADIAALGVAGICSEALHYLGLEHGYAHERYFVPLERAGALPPRALLLRALPRCGAGGRRRRRGGAPRAHARRSSARSQATTRRRARARRVRARPRAGRDVARRRGRGGRRRDAVRVHRALGRGQGLRRRPAHRRPVADDRLAARRRRRGGRSRLRRDRGDGLRGRPGVDRARPRHVRRGRGLRHLPPLDPGLRLGRGRCARRSTWPRARATPRRLLPLRPDAAGRAGLDPRRPRCRLFRARSSS